MTTEIMQAKMELKELVDTFSNLADVKDAASQGELFLPDGILEFQIGPDGEISNIVGREALVEAFSNTINPCKAVYHINGQHNVTVNESCTTAEGTAYCQATLVNDEDGKDIITTNYAELRNFCAIVQGDIGLIHVILSPNLSIYSPLFAQPAIFPSDSRT